ncbi:MAG: hypothetical protein U0350_10125 [Caldilineaceae bacterium]
MKLPKQIKPAAPKIERTSLKKQVKPADWDPACVARCNNVKDEQGRWICLNYCPQK